MTIPDLDALIAEVDRTCPTTDWIDRLATAAELAGRLQALGDDLVTEFVEHARFASRSWAEIGAALGVTKQAAQQRFLAPHKHYAPSELSDELQQAMPAIKQVAIHHRHNYIGTEHVLLGVTAQPTTATGLLASRGVPVEELRRTVQARLVLGASQAAARIAWTPYARRVMALAKDAATHQHAPAIGCEHVLIGVVRLGRGIAADALRDAGVTIETLSPAPNS
jgi:hypothetical protein